MKLQTMYKVAKLRRFPLLYSLAQWLCGKITGHEPGSDWGYGTGECADTWCRWCNKFMQVPKTTIQFQHKEFLSLMREVDTKTKPTR